MRASIPAPADFLHIGIGIHGRVIVIAQAPRIAIDDLAQLRQVFLDAQDLVDLLLVLDNREADAGMVEYVLHLLGDRVLVQRHRDRPGHLCRDHRPVKARPVGADDRDRLARLQAQLHQPQGQRAGFLGDFSPGPALPDAVFLLAAGG
jgi:hypothetical protein